MTARTGKSTQRKKLHMNRSNADTRRPCSAVCTRKVSRCERVGSGDRAWRVQEGGRELRRSKGSELEGYARDKFEPLWRVWGIYRSHASRREEASRRAKVCQ